MEQDKEQKNGYMLSRQWFDFAFENPDKVSPVHGILYLWMVELNNQTGWKEKFGLPTYHSMEAIGVKNYKTYKKAFQDLESWGFVKLMKKSQNQHTSNIIALVNNTKATTKARLKQVLKQVQSDAAIYKQLNKKTIKLENDGEPVIASEIILYLNEKSGKQFKSNTKKTKELIKARQNEGWGQTDFIKVIDNKVADWKDDPKMDNYLRPETLFSNKFESYLNEKQIPKKKVLPSSPQDLGDMKYDEKP